MLFILTIFIFTSFYFAQEKRRVFRRPVLIRDDRTKESEIPKDEVFKLDPKKSKKNMEVGKFYLKRKKYDAAIVRFMDAVKYNPKNDEAKYLLIKALYKKGNLTEAYNIGSGYLKQKISKKYNKKIEKLVLKSHEKMKNRKVGVKEKISPININ